MPCSFQIANVRVGHLKPTFGNLTYGTGRFQLQGLAT
jgi:hypothetical protein